MKLEQKVRLSIEDAFPGSSVKEFSELSGGFANETLLVRLEGDRELVLKIFGHEEAEDRDLWRDSFCSEPYVLDVLERETGIPAPRSVSRGELSGEGLNYHIMEKMPGQAPDITASGPYFRKLSVERKKEILESIGRSMAQYHSIDFGDLGPLTVVSGDLGVDTRGSWPEFFMEMIEHWSDGVSEPFEDLKPELVEAARSNLDLIQDVSGHCLLHRELDTKNILVRRGELSAIVDWEWCASGHREFDLAVTEGRMLMNQFQDRNRWKYYRESLYRAYRESEDLEKGWEKRRQLYLIFPLLWDMNFYQDSWDKPVELYRDRARHLIHSLE